MSAEQQECDYQNTEDSKEMPIVPDEKSQIMDNIKTTPKKTKPVVIYFTRYDPNHTPSVLAKIDNMVDKIFLLLFLIMCIGLGLYCWNIIFESVLPEVRMWLRDSRFFSRSF